MGFPIYRCSNCGRTFSTPNEAKTLVTEEIKGIKELILYLKCPRCGSIVEDKSIGVKL